MNKQSRNPMIEQAIHAGEDSNQEIAVVSPGICTSTSFPAHPDGVGFSASDLGDDAPYFYSRWANPTVRQLEKKMAALEGAEDGICFASGMAAIAGLFLTRLSQGDHLILSNVCYAGVAELAHDMLTRFGIAVSAVDTSDLAAVRAAVRPETKMIYCETPANPILRLSDIAGLAAVAREAGAELAVDSTLATPLATQPLALGADYVVHALTKYACGHGGDAIAGIVLGKAAAVAELRKQSLIHLGGALAPFNAWLILRSLHTLPLRMEAHQRGALAVANYLERHPRIGRVLYPGLPSHPQHDLAARQMANFSGMLSFSAKDGSALARQLAERLQLFTYAVSMGKSKSLVFYIPTEDLLRSSFHLDGEEAEKYRDWAGEGVFRVSIGLEQSEALIEDLEVALR